MLTAFSGLLLSKQLMLNQLSFFLIYCVILDTFVVRTILVPICMDSSTLLIWQSLIRCQTPWPFLWLGIVPKSPDIVGANLRGAVKISIEKERTSQKIDVNRH